MIQAFCSTFSIIEYFYHSFSNLTIFLNQSSDALLIENMRFHTKHMQRNPQKRWSRSDKITNEPPWSQKKKIMCWSYETWWWWHMLINYNEHTKGLVFSKYQLFCVFNLIRLYEIPIDSLISIFLDPTYHHIFSP